MRNGNFKYAKFLKLLFPLGLLLMGLVVQLLWNALMPDIFGLPMLGYWKALGLLILSRLLFGGLGGGRHRHGGGMPPWKAGSPPPWKEKWMQMSEEERAKFRADRMRHCKKTEANDPE
jgi:hypothetical protein